MDLQSWFSAERARKSQANMPSNKWMETRSLQGRASGDLRATNLSITTQQETLESQELHTPKAIDSSASVRMNQARTSEMFCRLV
jgi:hypothetical protein